MRYVKRIVVVEVEDPRTSTKYLSHILLYTFIVSRGIRIDTTLITIGPREVVVLEGSKLRHLYPQESSLEGFVKTVYCRGKLLPGVRRLDRKHTRIPGVFTRECRRALIVTPEGGKPENPCSLMYRIHPDVDCLVVDLTKKQLLSKEELHRVVFRGINSSNPVEAIAVIQFILDTMYGALIRRKGDVVYVRGLCRGGKGESR